MVGPDLDFEMKTLKRVPQKQILGFLNEPSHFKLVLFPKQYIIGKEFKALYRFQIQGEIRNMSPRKKQRFFCKKGGVPYLASLSLSSLSLFLFSLSKFPLFLRKQRLFYSSLYQPMPLYICFVLLLFHVTNLSISIVIETHSTSTQHEKKISNSI